MQRGCPLVGEESPVGVPRAARLAAVAGNPPRAGDIGVVPELGVLPKRRRSRFFSPGVRKVDGWRENIHQARCAEPEILLTDFLCGRSRFEDGTCVAARPQLAKRHMFLPGYISKSTNNA